MARVVLIALGANVEGRFGDPQSALVRGIECLRLSGLKPVAVSGLYRTLPVAGGKQPQYFNAVAAFQSAVSVFCLLRLLKRIERQSGRFQRGRNAARPLDLDIIAAHDFVIGWQQRKSGLAIRARPPAAGNKPGRRRPIRPRIVLPHPEMHRRRFVLEPLVEIAPFWWHPLLHATARTLLRRLPRRTGDVVRVLASNWSS